MSNPVPGCREEPGAAAPPVYLVESYVPPRSDAVDDIEGALARLVDAQRMVRHVATTYIPGDDVVLHVVSAASERSLRARLDAVGMSADRITPVVVCQPTTPTTRQRRAAGTEPR